MIALFSYAPSENSNHVTAKEEVGDHFKGINGDGLIHRVVRGAPWQDFWKVRLGTLSLGLI